MRSLWIVSGILGVTAVGLGAYIYKGLREEYGPLFFGGSSERLSITLEAAEDPAGRKKQAMFLRALCQATDVSDADRAKYLRIADLLDG